MNTQAPIAVDFTTGNFDLAIKAVLKEDVIAKFVKNGFNWVIQRDVATKTYVALAGEANEKGKLVLPDGFKRNSIAYSDDKAAEFALAAEKVLGDYCESVSVTVTEHEEAEAVGSRKMATAMWEKGKTKGAAFFAALSIDEGVSDEEGIEACHAYLQSLRSPKS